MTNTKIKVAPAGTSHKRTIIGTGIGNFVEWFDFTAYGAVAVIIGMHFFPSESSVASLLGAFAALAVAFVFRILGGFVFGYLGDRIGRKNTLAYAILLMSGATFAIGTLPTYEQIGVFASILLLLCRCLQGLAIGGEWSTATVFLGESSPEGKRGLFTSVIPATSWFGSAAGVATVASLSWILGHAAVEDWAWRVPFLLAGPLGIIGLLIRMKLSETTEFTNLKRTESKRRRPIREALRSNWRGILVLFMVSGLHGAWIYSVIAYMVSYLQNDIGVAPTVALVTNTIAAALASVATIVAGIYVDRVGRKRLLIVGGAIMALTSIPVFLFIGMGVLPAVMLGQLALTFMAPLVSTPLATLTVELFPADVRASAAAIGNALGASLIGGSFPLVATWLSAKLGDPLAPAYMLTGIAVAMVIVVLILLRETRGKPLPISQNMASMNLEGEQVERQN